MSSTSATSSTMTRRAPSRAAHAATGRVRNRTSRPHAVTVMPRSSTDKVRPVDVKALVDIRDVTVPGGPVGTTWLRLFRPAGTSEPLPVVVYVHGDRKVLGNARTRRLVTKLAIDLEAAVIVVDYSLSPKARIPVASEENYAAIAWVAAHSNEQGLDSTRIAVAADSISGDMAADLMLMADERGGPTLAAHVSLSPKTTAVLRAALAA